MNRTPPSAESISFPVLIAVEPRCSPTRSARCASITSGRTSSPRAVKMRPRILATVVLPVPGGPQLGGDLVHLPLDRLQADQLVHLREGALQRGYLAIAPEPGGELGPGP